MATRINRKRIADETVAVLHTGSYIAPSGATVDIALELEDARFGTKVYTPGALGRTLNQVLASDAISRDNQTRFEVANETTFAGVRRLLAQGAPHVLALNFASAKNPGGGFLNGSSAQEESLARASGLYACLAEQMASYYDINRACGTALYTDHMIYSPAVPVFRDDDDHFIEEPYPCSIITAPAPNAGALARNENDRLGEVEAIFRRRIDYVLAIAAEQGHTHLVLGAWGCGVFRNDPQQVAQWFRESLTDTARFAGVFEQVVFSVLDFSEERRFVRPFESAFAELV